MKRMQSDEYEGIPVFLKFSTVAAELSSYEKERRAIQVARQYGWQYALNQMYDSKTISYSTDPVRQKFLDLLPLNKSMHALEIGVGFGQHTAAIASRVRHLDVLEIRLVNALFAKLKCEQLGLTNVSFVCGGDDCTLPFPTDSYDAIIFNLVLEWCAGALGPPALKGQTLLLSELHRVLKPTGLLQLSTKNRFSYRLLLGGRDEHAFNLPFGSAMPRWMLRLLLKSQRRSEPAGYLHSYPALQQLLKKRGL